MHAAASTYAIEFLKKYLKADDMVLEVGSRISTKDTDGLAQVIFSKLKGKRFFPPVKYTGLDVKEGKNVTVVVKDPYYWEELPDESFDIVISVSTFEHIEFFWLVFLEMARVLKTGGYMCVIAPKIHKVHRYPVDCWRFMPDGMAALAKWAGIKCINAAAQGESYERKIAMPNDCVGWFQK